MPDTWSGHKRTSGMKYQIVIIVSLLRNRPWLRDVSPSFAAICQYLSSTVREAGAVHFLSTEEENPETSPSAGEKQFVETVI
jgi:hypothetical protein